MKKLLLSSVALFGLTAGATAADLPRRQYVAPAPYVAVPVFTWTGFYVGVNAGAAFRDNNRDNTCIDSFGFGFGDCFGGSGLAVQTNAGLAPVVPLTGFNALGFGSSERRDDAVFAGGGQIGYNYQFTPGSGWVIGIEADIQGLANNRRNDDDLPSLPSAALVALTASSRRLRWLPLRRARASPTRPASATVRWATWPCSVVAHSAAASTSAVLILVDGGEAEGPHRLGKGLGGYSWPVGSDSRSGWRCSTAC